MDFERVTYKDDRFLVDSYLLHRDFEVLSLMGSTRSIGMEDLGYLVDRLGETYLADGWLTYQNHVWEEPFVRGFLAIRGVWEKERQGFVWGYLLCGNPFALLAVTFRVIVAVKLLSFL